MNINGKEMSLGLVVGKFLKIIGIWLGFVWPTIRAKSILSLYGCKYGKHLKVCGKVHFRPSTSGSIVLGHNVQLISRFLTNTVGITNPTVFDCTKFGRIEIGNNTGLTSAIISSRVGVHIGSHVKIGANVRIFDHDFHSLDMNMRRDSRTDGPNTNSSKVYIEDNVFIGTNSIILKGVHIGEGSIIGAGSVVAIKKVPPFSTVAGNPARIIGNSRGA